MNKGTWRDYKITRLNFFPLPCKLGNSERCVVLACVLPSIHGYNFKVVRQTVWQQLLLEVDRVLVHRQSHVKCLRGATRQCEILCETWKIR